MQTEVRREIEGAVGRLEGLAAEMSTRFATGGYTSAADLAAFAKRLKINTGIIKVELSKVRGQAGKRKKPKPDAREES